MRWRAAKDYSGIVANLACEKYKSCGDSITKVVTNELFNTVVEFDDIAFDIKTLLSFPVLVHFLLLDLEHFHPRRLSMHLNFEKLN